MIRILIRASILALAGCASVPAEAGPSWPAGLPSRRYYESVWEADERNREIQTCGQYLAWVESFYAGSMFVPGWHRRQSDLVRLLDAGQARLAEPEIARLGQLMSSEWAKDNRTRRISSELLVLWGGVMGEACRRGEALATLDAIAGDLRELLAGRLDPAALGRDRYLGAPTSRP